MQFNTTMVWSCQAASPETNGRHIKITSIFLSLSLIHIYTISVFSVNVTIRKDVTDYFNSTGLNLDSTGFHVEIPVEKIEKGHYNIGLYIVRGNQIGMMYSDKYIDIGK